MAKVGIDIIDLNRVKNPSDGFLRHVLSNKEMAIYDSYGEQRKIEYLGGRFAAKEAIIKCLSDIEIPNMNEISVLNDEKGRPYVVYKNYEIEVSISHEKDYAVAYAMLTK